jgi:uncharacterized membrane protein YcaP (DUF421 family)
MPHRLVAFPSITHEGKRTKVNRRERMESVFGSGSDLAWYQECARGALIFLYGLALVRIAGRRVFGKWSALDVIVSIIIGSNLSRALTGSAALWGTLAATTLLIALHWILAKLVARSPGFSQFIEGRAAELVQSGAAIRSALHRHSVSEADLHEALRQAGVNELSATKAVTLEPSGKITVLKS